MQGEEKREKQCRVKKRGSGGTVEGKTGEKEENE